MPALAILVALSQLSAEPPPPEPEKIKVSVVAVLAHNRDSNVDSRLKCLAEELRKAVPKLTGFKMGKMSCRSLTVGARETFELVDDQVAVLTLVRAADKGNVIELKLTPPQMGEVTYETSCGCFFPIITKYRTRDTNDVLIVAVRVQSCRK
jgi:hypothetical protein